jgi:glyoxylate carboligase
MAFVHRHRDVKTQLAQTQLLTSRLHGSQGTGQAHIQLALLPGAGVQRQGLAGPHIESAIADSIPILCITGQAPRARLYNEDFQAVDIEAISKPVTKWSYSVREPGQVPRAFQLAFHLMRSGRPGPVLLVRPFGVQMTEIEFDIDTYEPLPVYKPHATRKQIE